MIKKDHLCKCGCGKLAKKCYDKTGRFKQYCLYAEGCVPNIMTEKRIAALLKFKGSGNPRSLPVGTRRLQRSTHNIYYYIIKISDKPEWIYEHRYLIEQLIGRKLLKNEIVHHKDGNTLNNSIDNLILMTSSKHSSLHHSNILTHNHKGRILKNGEWSFKHKNCIKCGTTTTPHRGNGLCDNCYELLRRHGTKEAFIKNLTVEYTA